MLQEKEKVKQSREFVIQRVFNAPRNLLWKTFAEAGRLAEWWGPVGFKMRVSKLEFSPGGTFHYSMQSPDGFVMWGKFVYLEIVEPRKLVFVLSFSDETGGITRAPMNETWPLEVFNVLTLTEQNGKTSLTLRGGPINATAEEIKTFEAGFSSMQQGFTATFDQLEEYLSKF